ncbi:hypothetical protein CLOM_g11382 [Closterium sp. NIES-68]|nr:hypothetical protein CLOM_g11382 [Closterium sp. NIES-68]GJP79515.1 hypothetical protein CLOP_g9741 [Closterium sp. NIES-67]
MADGNYPTTGQWTTGCCGCFEDCNSCCCVLWCPCVAVGRIAEIADAGEADSGQTCLFWYLLECLTRCGCLLAHGYRRKLRSKYGLPAKPCGDLCMHCFCEFCSIAQEYRELKNRGWDPSIGYLGNKNKSPPPQQFMQ